MSFTQQDLEAIKRAIASGELVVQFSDRRVQYRSMDELLKARGVIEAELSVLENAGRQRSRVSRLFHAGRGF